MTGAGTRANFAWIIADSFRLIPMVEQPDSFTAAWRFNPQLSKLSTQPPRSWIQEILVNSHEVRVRETIVRADGSETLVSLRAKFDGNDYPVEGSPAADTIAYTRLDRNTISGTGKKNGIVSLTETVRVAPEQGNLTLSYSLHASSKVVAQGIAVFERDS
jgi:hypothetical protein